MPTYQLIADSGATKTQWSLLGGTTIIQFTTKGISPYFFNSLQISQLLKEELLPHLGEITVGQIFFYGTGCAVPANIELVKEGLRLAFGPQPDIVVESDMMGAARALCGRNPGVACILGTGSNSCVFNGVAIEKNNPAPGFILGDEGSGAHLGKKVLQYYIYNTFDEELMFKFQEKFQTDYRTILQHVYKEPWPNRYLAGYAPFLSENRGHYMIENIIEDSLSEFFFTHLYKYPESWTYPIHFNGSIAWHFKDVLQELCGSFELELGNVLKAPMEGLEVYHGQSGGIK